MFSERERGSAAHRNCILWPVVRDAARWRTSDPDEPEEKAMPFDAPLSRRERTVFMNRLFLSAMLQLTE